MDTHKHTYTSEKRRGFQPPWYRVVVVTCPDGAHAVTLRVPKGGFGPGAVVGNCGHLVQL